MSEAKSVNVTLPNGTKYDQPTGLYINGKFVSAKDGKTFETVNPATGKPIISIQEGTEADVDIAVDAARKVFDNPKSEWRTTTPSGRSKILSKIADLMLANLDELAAVEAMDCGKALSLAKMDVSIASDTIRYYGGWADKIHGQTVDTDPATFRYTRHEAVGVCGCIIPWNFPLLMFSWKIGPALATGNCVVMKTAEQTPLSALVFCKYLKEAGLPDGVLNVISGFGKTAGAAVASHMKIDKIAFTGSTITGRSIMKAAASSNLKKVTLELGGKSPTIVYDDADIEQAIAWTAFGIFYNQGNKIIYLSVASTAKASRGVLLRR